MSYRAYTGLTSYLKTLYTSSQWRMACRVIAFVEEVKHFFLCQRLEKGSFIHNQCFLPSQETGLVAIYSRKRVIVGRIECKCEADTTRLSEGCTIAAFGRSQEPQHFAISSFYLFLRATLYTPGWEGKMAQDNTNTETKFIWVMRKTTAARSKHCTGEWVTVIE